jgi:hypothetical protein
MWRNSGLPVAFFVDLAASKGDKADVCERLVHRLPYSFAGDRGATQLQRMWENKNEDDETGAPRHSGSRCCVG